MANALYIQLDRTRNEEELFWVRITYGGDAEAQDAKGHRPLPGAAQKSRPDVSERQQCVRDRREDNRRHTTERSADGLGSTRWRERERERCTLIE